VPSPATPAAAATIAGALRRLAAALYDGLLLLGVVVLMTLALLALNGGAAITRAAVGRWEYGYVALLLGVVAAYYGTAWTRSGETLGMKAWRIRVEASSGARLGWRAALVRLACAAPLYLLALGGLLAFVARLGGGRLLATCCLPLAASYAWLLVSSRGTLHDRLSRTRVVRPPPGR
jgi:uncharacterized RDD family membrane protein YckC